MRPQADTEWLVTKAQSLGFDLCGVAPASELIAPAHRGEWLARGYAGQMQYLHDPRRADPAAVLPSAKSVIVCAINYNTPQPYSTEVAAASDPGAWISRYAWGDDYHVVIGEKLDAVLASMTEQFAAEQFLARAYVDTGPISERIAARQAGLGWLAKNTCLINETLGSWLFLGLILTTLDLAPTSPRESSAAPTVPPPDLCGNCTLCLEACPTGALVEPYVLDASRCISYLTIELRDSIPEEFRVPIGRQVFGCDICQDVCPWNRKAPAAPNPAFAPRENLVAPEIEWLLSLTEDDFRLIFKNSAVRRTKWRGLIRNACIAAGNSRDKRGKDSTRAATASLQARLTQLAADSDPVIAEHAQWALTQLAATHT
jgi:epoxyqueuosine reductase